MRSVGRDWGLPKPIVEVMGLHHRPWKELQAAPQEFLPLLLCVRIGDAFSHAIGLGDADHGALARAHRWQRMLDSGEAAGVEAIAVQHGVDRTYIARILNLATLAPDIVGAIVKGTEPSGMSLRKMLAEPLPVRWDQQRTALGMR